MKGNYYGIDVNKLKSPPDDGIWERKTNGQPVSVTALTRIDGDPEEYYRQNYPKKVRMVNGELKEAIVLVDQPEVPSERIRKVGTVDYLKMIVPEDYKCDGCGAKDVRLWREYNTIASQTDLLCAECAEINQRKNHEPGWISPFVKGEGDQIGWFMPAVPVEGRDTYWGYTSVPEEGVNWWSNLSLMRIKKYRLGNQAQEYELKTNYLGWIPENDNWGDLSFSSVKNKEITIVNPENQEKRTIFLHRMVIKDAFPLSFYGEKRADDWNLFGIVSDNELSEKYLIPLH